MVGGNKRTMVFQNVALLRVMVPCFLLLNIPSLCIMRVKNTCIPLSQGEPVSIRPPASQNAWKKIQCFSGNTEKVNEAKRHGAVCGKNLVLWTYFYDYFCILLHE